MRRLALFLLHFSRVELMTSFIAVIAPWRDSGLDELRWRCVSVHVGVLDVRGRLTDGWFVGAWNGVDRGRWVVRRALDVLIRRGLLELDRHCRGVSACRRWLRWVISHWNGRFLPFQKNANSPPDFFSVVLVCVKLFFFQKFVSNASKAVWQSRLVSGQTFIPLKNIVRSTAAGDTTASVAGQG